jgi:hypothetical protein
MLVRLFRQNQPAVLLLLPRLLLLLWPGTAIDHAAGAVRMREGMPLYALLQGLWAMPMAVQGVVGSLLALGTALLVDRVAGGAELYDRPNHLPALLVVLLLAVGPGALWPDPALLGMPWVLWALARTWGVQGRSHVLGVLFDAGLLLGIAALWYAPYVFLLVVVWASVAVMRPFHWREHVLPLLGMAVVLFLCWAVLKVSGSPEWHPLRTAVDATAKGRALVLSGLRTSILLALMVPLVLVSLVAFAGLYGRSIMREKNVRSSFLALTLALGILMAFEWLLNRTFPGVLLAVPLAVLCGYGLLRTRRTWLAELAVASLLGIALWTRWAP